MTCGGEPIKYELPRFYQEKLKVTEGFFLKRVGQKGIERFLGQRVWFFESLVGLKRELK